MKKFLLVLITILALSFTVQETNYILLFEDSSSAKYFKYGKTNYFEYFADTKENIKGKDYYVRYRKYGWGKIDTVFYRKGVEFYYNYDKKTQQESLVLPIHPKLGDTWSSADGNWSYEVIAVDQKFKAKRKKFKGCIQVHCKQLSNADKDKRAEYFLYYSPEFGYVGNVDSKGKVLSYLSEIKLNAKQGDKIGGK